VSGPGARAAEPAAPRRAPSRAIFTLALGAPRESALTLPLLERYARRVGAELVVARGPFPGRDACRLRKLDVGPLLERHDRVLYVDGDVAVRPDAPDVFALVPAARVGGTLEGPPLFRSRHDPLRRACAHYGAPDPGPRDAWLNTGLIVVSRAHRELFAPVTELARFGAGWSDQALLNARLVAHGFEPYDLGPAFNYLGSLARRARRPFEPYDAYFFHATGSLAGLREWYLRRVIGLWRGGGAPHGLARAVAKAQFAALAAWTRWRRPPKW